MKNTVTFRERGINYINEIHLLSLNHLSTRETLRSRTGTGDKWDDLSGTVRHVLYMIKRDTI